MGNSVVDLGAAGSSTYLDMGDMSLNDAMGLTRDNPAYMQESGFSGPAYAEDQTRPADLTGPFLEEYAPVDGAYQRLDYYDMYQDFPEGRSGSDFGPSAPEIAMREGGIVGGLENLGRMSTAMIESLDRVVYGDGSGGKGRPTAPANIPMQHVGGILGGGTAFPVPQNALGGGLLPPPIQPEGMQDQNIHAGLSAQYGPLPPGRYASNIQKEMSPDSRYFNVPDRSQMQPLVGFNENNPYQMQPLGSSDANKQNLMLSQGLLGIPDATPLGQGTNLRSIFASRPSLFNQGGEVPVGGIMSVDLSKGADTTGPDTMQPIPQYPGIEGFDIYKDLAPEQFKRRPIDKQMFDKKRGFQFGQMVELRNEAVGGKLLKQAGIQAPVKQVLANLDPKVMEQVSTILGREVG